MPGQENWCGLTCQSRTLCSWKTAYIYYLWCNSTQMLCCVHRIIHIVAVNRWVCTNMSVLCLDSFCVLLLALGFLIKCLQQCWKTAFSWLQKSFLGHRHGDKHNSDCVFSDISIILGLWALSSRDWRGQKEQTSERVSIRPRVYSSWALFQELLTTLLLNPHSNPMRSIAITSYFSDQETEAQRWLYICPMSHRWQSWIDLSIWNFFIYFSFSEIATLLKDIGLNFMCGRPILEACVEWSRTWLPWPHLVRTWGQKGEDDECNLLTLTLASPHMCSLLWTVCGCLGGAGWKLHRSLLDSPCQAC